MAETNDQAEEVSPAGSMPNSASVEAPSSGGIKKLFESVGRFWQLISALIGIVTVCVAGLTYFATRDQLSQMDCLTHISLTMTTAPIERDQLAMQIELAQRDLLLTKPDSIESLRLKNSIEDFAARKKKKSDELDDAIKKVQQRVCSAAASPPDKKP